MNLSLSKRFIKLNSTNRLYKLDIPIIALTGGIATGKSTVSDILINQNLPVICADNLVKKIYQLDEIKTLVKHLFNEVIDDSNNINFPLLRKLVFQNNTKKTKLENSIYKHLESTFKNELIRFKNLQFVFFDVPLLFEKKLHSMVDLIICVYSPLKDQKHRLVKRDCTEQETINNILSNQMNIEEKKQKSDFVLNNVTTTHELKNQTINLLNKILETCTNQIH